MAGRVLVVDDSATVRKIVGLVLEEAGYDVVAVADGQQGLDVIQREPFDLALVDFVMPRLNGYQLAQAVRSIEHLRELPIVLMSAKAEQIGERFMRQTGAVDAITKPFSPDAIVAVVNHALNRRLSQAPAPTLVREELAVPPTLRPPPALSDADAEELDAELDDTDVEKLHARGTVPEAPGVSPLVLAQAGAAHHVADVLARAIVPAVERALGGGRAPDASDLREAILRGLTPGELAALAREFRAFDTELRGPVALEGAIEKVPLGELLQLLRLQQQTGALIVQRKASEVAVAFRAGQIEVALARGVSGEFLLGRYLAADRLVSRDELDAINRARPPDSGWLGEYLVREGRITAADLERALTRQTSEIIYEVLRWEEGRFRFEHGVTLPEAQGARLGLPVESLVLEGFRRVDEWRLIEQEVGSFDLVLARDEAVIEAVGSARLAREERLVLEAIDGARSVRDVVQAVSMSSFDVCKILYRLLRSKLLRRRAA